MQTLEVSTGAIFPPGTTFGISQGSLTGTAYSLVLFFVTHAYSLVLHLLPDTRKPWLKAQLFMCFAVPDAMRKSMIFTRQYWHWSSACRSLAWNLSLGSRLCTAATAKALASTRPQRTGGAYFQSCQLLQLLYITSSRLRRHASLNRRLPPQLRNRNLAHNRSHPAPPLVPARCTALSQPHQRMCRTQLSERAWQLSLPT